MLNYSSSEKERLFHSCHNVYRFCVVDDSEMRIGGKHNVPDEYCPSRIEVKRAGAVLEYCRESQLGVLLDPSTNDDADLLVINSGRYDCRRGRSSSVIFSESRRTLCMALLFLGVAWPNQETREETDEALELARLLFTEKS